MKRLIPFLLLCTIAILLLACSEAEPIPTPEPEPTEVTEVEATPTEEPEEEEPTAVPEPTDESGADPEPTEAPDETEAPVDGERAVIVNDEGGPVSITGVVTYTNPFFTLGVAAPLVILEDQAGFVDRDENYLMPVASQTLGQITSDFYESPFSYSIALPIEPQGGFRDVDNDGEQDQGIQVFAPAYWNNTFDDPFLQERDLHGGGWSTAYASTIVSEDPELEREIVGGKFLVYAPDDQQGFPSGFGDDGLLFTEDDPIVILPQGYTVVDLDTDTFTFDRSREQVIDLVEPEGAALVDYSDQSYAEAFNSLVDQLSNEYAFTEYKEIDWEALRDQFLPRFEEADADEDSTAYQRALRDFAWSIPDGHVAGPFVTDDFREAVLGGIGISIRETDEGQAYVVFLTEGGPADLAGIEFGAEITAVNSTPIAEHISNTVSHFAPYSTPHSERMDLLLFSTRFPLGTEVEVSYINPESSAEETAVLTAGSELESYYYWQDIAARDGFELPVEYELLDEGVGYVSIYSFSDNDLLSAQLWERMIREMNENQVPAIIIDMRENGGGSGFLADALAAYFFDEELTLGNTAYYDEERGEFYMDPEDADHFYLPSEDLRYEGEIVVLVGPSCASACEFFSYDMTLDDRATIIGHYPTAGLGGSIDRVAMPDDIEFTFTQGRAVDAEGNIHIEGIGVVPDIDVPVTRESLLGEQDMVLQAAVDLLVGAVADGGPIAVGTAVSDTVNAGERVRYTLDLTAEDVVSIFLESTSGEDLILRVYDLGDNLLAETDPNTLGGFEDVALGEVVTLVLEVAAAEDDTAVEYTLTIEE